MNPRYPYVFMTLSRATLIPDEQRPAAYRAARLTDKIHVSWAVDVYRRRRYELVENPSSPVDYHRSQAPTFGTLSACK